MSIPRTASTDPKRTHSPRMRIRSSPSSPSAIVPDRRRPGSKSDISSRADVAGSGGEGAAALRDRDQAGRRFEALAVLGGELTGPGHEAGRATARRSLEPVDVLDRA